MTGTSPGGSGMPASTLACITNEPCRAAGGRRPRSSRPQPSNLDLGKPRVTELLNRWSSTAGEAGHEGFSLVYDELRRIAAGYLRRERNASGLQATSIVNEAYLRLAGQKGFQWRSRDHFFAFSSRLMRRILVDEARRRNRSKRGGSAVHISLTDAANAAAEEPNLDVLVVDEALTALARIDPEKAALVELRFFAGLSLEETARALEVSLSTVHRQWRLAKAWLSDRLRGTHTDSISKHP